MALDISARFSFSFQHPGDTLLQFEVADLPEQSVISTRCDMTPALHVARVPAQENIGERIWMRSQGEIVVDYSARVEVQRQAPDISGLHAMDPHALPGEAVQYLFDSRYCQADRMQSFVESRFGDVEGGAKIAEMSRWISEEVAYEPGSSNAYTTATDTFVERRGICRDFAHVMVAFARAATIPARYVSCYAPGVSPQDFHAVAEVFLADPTVPGGGAWYMVDPTGMADPAQTAKIGVGRDAADVSFMTVFCHTYFGPHEVSVTLAD